MHEALKQAKELYAAGKPSRALVGLFHHIDDKLLAGEFKYVDDLLSPLDPEELPLMLRLGVLTITLAAKASLPSRTAYFTRVAKSLENEPLDRILGLLGGLE